MPTRTQDTTEPFHVTKIKRLINRWVLVRKTQQGDVLDDDGRGRVNRGVKEDGKEILAYDDFLAEETDFCEIQAVSSDCQIFTEACIGWLAKCPEFVSRQHNIAFRDVNCYWRHEYWIFHEEEILACM